MTNYIIKRAYLPGEIILDNLANVFSHLGDLEFFFLLQKARDEAN